MSHRPYLPIEPALVDHPKTRALAKIWGCHPYLVVGFLVKLWGYCLEFQEDGAVDGRPADVLDELAAPCLRTSLGVLPTVREALLRAGFIDEDGRLHDWDEYAGALVERRRKDRRRKRLARQQEQRTSSGQDTDTPRTSGRRVEKSREEKSRVEVKQQPAAAPEASQVSVPTLDYATRCVIAVNQELERLLAGSYRSLVATVEAPIAAAWEAAGIPIALAEQVCRDRTATFRSTPLNRQPNTLRYFDAAVREAAAKRDASAAPRPLKEYEQMDQLAAAERLREAKAAP